MANNYGGIFLKWQMREFSIDRGIVFSNKSIIVDALRLKPCCSLLVSNLRANRKWALHPALRHTRSVGRKVGFLKFSRIHRLLLWGNLADLSRAKLWALEDEQFNPYNVASGYTLWPNICSFLPQACLRWILILMAAVLPNCMRCEFLLKPVGWILRWLWLHRQVSK